MLTFIACLSTGVYIEGALEYLVKKDECKSHLTRLIAGSVATATWAAILIFQ